MNWRDKRIINLIDEALREDLGVGDMTSEAIVPSDLQGHARIVAKEAGVVAGIFLAEQVFKRADRRTRFKIYKPDGSVIKKGEVLALACGKMRSILKAERVALNFLQRLCGIATLTDRFVKQVRGTKTKILDTRKTTPTFRRLEKYAVRMGGGENHRFGLYDMILIKGNHISAVGDAGKAILKARLFLRRQARKDVKIEVEVGNQGELRRVVNLEVDRVMLDNMSLGDIRKCVKLVRSSPRNMEIEVSGRVNLEDARKIARTGVDFISVGALTHSAPALDLSLVTS